MLMDQARKPTQERCATSLGVFSGIVKEMDQRVVWVLLHCGARWCWVPNYLAVGLQVGDHVMLTCLQTHLGICGKPLGTPLREGHTTRRRLRRAA